MSDPFSILGLAAAFDLTDAEIERAYLARAALAHPDIVGSDEGASLQAAALNEARARLLDLESRANVLLEACGGPPKEADRALPPGFLMQMLETRELIQAAIASGDQAQADAWRMWADEERKRYITEVTRLFNSVPPQLAKIRETLNAWRYVERLIEQLAPGYTPPEAESKSR